MCSVRVQKGRQQDTQSEIEDVIAANQASEWKTLFLIVACYSWWALSVMWVASSSEWVASVCLLPALVLHSSLQHEVIHNHPTRYGWVNEWLIHWPLAMLVPYRRYCELHLEHHRDENLTDPYDDPESWYLTQDDWQKCAQPLRFILQANNTLVGRVFIGPLLSVWRLYTGDLIKIVSGDRKILYGWLFHFLGLAIVLTYVLKASALPVWAYLLTAWMSMGGLMIRSFLEHQAHDKVRGRSVIVKAKGLLSFLFLNNSLHAVHHARPNLPWYELRRHYNASRAHYDALNLDYNYSGYGEIIRKYAFKRKERVEHPDV